MQIWMVYGLGIPPQHIGNVDAVEYGKGLVAKAHSARHTEVKVIAKGSRGNDVTAYAFRDFSTLKAFADRNDDITFSDFVLS